MIHVLQGNNYVNDPVLKKDQIELKELKSSPEIGGKEECCTMNECESVLLYLPKCVSVQDEYGVRLEWANARKGF